MKHLHTFTQHLNESNLREIAIIEYLRKIREVRKNRPPRLSVEESEELKDLYHFLDPDGNGSYFKTYDGRFKIKLDEETEFSQIKVTKNSESEWLVSDRGDGDGTMSVYETSSLKFAIEYLSTKYGPPSVVWTEIR